MKEKAGNWYTQKIGCPLCSGGQFLVLGIRGNREYFGADPNAEPHIYTEVVKCVHCHFIFTNPMIYGMEHLESSYYNNPSKYQTDELGHIPEMFERRLDYISSFSKGGTLLDVGAGKGEFLAMAKKRGWNVFGVEPSEKFCQYAQDRFQISIKQGYLESSTFGDKKFDLVTLNHVLEHVDHPQPLLELVSQYISKEGILFIEVPNTESVVLKLADLYFRLKGLRWSSRLSPLHPPFHRYGYSKRSLRYILEKSGYEVLDFKTYSGKDRGYKKTGLSVSTMLRDAASSIINIVGNRELLAVIAKPVR